MGKFDGYLILSDLDDTFRGGPGTVEKHSEAIRYFTENGGRFSFATGRGADHLKQQSFFDLINAPGCLFNGGYVYDFARDTYLHRTYLDFTVGQFADALQPYDFPMREAHIPMDPFMRACGKDLYTLPEAVRELTLMKVVVVLETPAAAEAFHGMVKDLPLFKNSHVSRTWDVGVEFTAANGTKGHALDFIKDYLGNIHTAIGVGNYDNDIPLLEHADVGVAVGNAPENVKQAADLVVDACKDFGLCQLIELIEQGKLRK